MRCSQSLPITLALGLTLSAESTRMIFAAAGPNADDVRSTILSFQTALGPLNGNPEGRHEINWDAVPASFSASNSLPPDFFNRNSVRAAVLSAWTGLQVAVNAADGPVRFDNLYNGSSALFPVFSAEKLFTLTGSNDYNVDFFMPATRSRSKVKGFGAVFANVSLPFTSSLEFFNADGLSLGMFYVPPAPRGLSFVGVMFTGRMVTRVRVVQGTVVPGAPEDLVSGQNAVVLDDFIYGEPVSDCIAN
jgi:hypothetical protein